MSDKLLIDRKLLERLQERLDPHIDARDWGMVRDALRAQLPSQGGEAVEAVAYIDDGGALYTSQLLEIMSVESDGCEPLMTVAQHQRIMAALTPPSPNADLVELLRNKFPRIDPCKPVPLDEKAHCCEYTIYVERERLHRLIDAKLASLKP